MDYQSFLDHIQTEGCTWLRNFDTGFGAYYNNVHNGKVAFLKRDSWVPWPIVIAFCRDIGIDRPAHLQHKEAEYDELGLSE